jgi:metal-dependent amidase/aminoacylase/carboxypeptidase family protein
MMSQVPTMARMASWRHALHRMPEIAFTEHRTSKFIVERLSSFGDGCVEIRSGLGGGTGIVATIRGTGQLAVDAPRRAIALRADIDALPITEEADVPYKSEIPGVIRSHLEYVDKRR